MLRTSLSTGSSTSATHIVVKYNGINIDNGRSSDFDRKFHLRLFTIVASLTLMLRTCSLLDVSTSATQLVIKYDEFDGDSGKLVEKLSKSWRIIKSQKTSKVLRVAKVIGLEECLPKY